MVGRHQRRAVFECDAFRQVPRDGLALREHTAVRTPQRHTNELGEAGGTALGAALQSEHCRLTSLDLRNNFRLGEAAKANLRAFPWVLL